MTPCRSHQGEGGARGDEEGRPAERGVPAYRELAEKLRADIEAGVYSVGRKMPTESVLQSVHNVSRHTVREALQILLSDGLIYRVQGSGTYVSGRQQDTRGRYVRSIGSSTKLSSGPIRTPR